MKKISLLFAVTAVCLVFTAFSPAMAGEGTLTIPFMLYNSAPSPEPSAAMMLTTEHATLTNRGDAQIAIDITAYDMNGASLITVPVTLNAHASMMLDVQTYCDALGVNGASFVIDWTGDVAIGPLAVIAVVASDVRGLPAAAVSFTVE